MPRPVLPPRWKKGESGNPAGRKKGVKTLKTTLTALMKSTIQYKDMDGNEAKMKGEDALAIALFAKALTTGDVRAIELIRNVLEGDKPKDDNERPITEEQKQIVERFMGRMLPHFEKVKDVTPE